MSCIKYENIFPFVKYEIPTTTDLQKHVNYILVHSENFKQLRGILIVVRVKL